MEWNGMEWNEWNDRTDLSNNRCFVYSFSCHYGWRRKPVHVPEKISMNMLLRDVIDMKLVFSPIAYFNFHAYEKKKIEIDKNYKIEKLSLVLKRKIWFKNI